MKARHWSLAIVLILINYIIFATLFTWLIDTDFSLDHTTQTPIPTFTPAPAQPPIIISTPTPVTPIPTPTATRVLPDSNQSAAPNNPSDMANAPANLAEPGTEPQLVAPGSVNIRSGPGIDFDVVGTLNADTPMPIVARNGDASWWQIKISKERNGWVANSVVKVSHTDRVPLAQASEVTVVEASVAQPANDTPKYQFEPTGWHDGEKAGLTRFWGNITDANGDPVDGVFVRATCGAYSVISYPSGPVGWGSGNESNDWATGFYDLSVDDRPIPCIWTLAVVDTEDRKSVTTVLSEAIPVEITLDKSVIVANWRQNW